MLRGSCHCGTFRFEVPAKPAFLLRCNCSFCAKRGSLWGYYPPESFRCEGDPAAVATYLWGRRTISHHFCARCGCSTYAEGGTSWETGEPHIAVNSLLFDDVDLADVPIEEVDGRNGW